MRQSNSSIDKVGNIIRVGKADGRYDDALNKLYDWRESHGEILNDYYTKCLKLANRIDKKDIIVAQRLKRLSTTRRLRTRIIWW